MGSQTRMWSDTQIVGPQVSRPHRRTGRISTGRRNDPRLVLSADPTRRPPTYNRRVINLLRPFLNEPSAPGASAAGWRDRALAAALVPIAVAEAALRHDLPYRWASLVVTLIAIPSILVRRTRPLLAVVIAFAPSLALDLTRLATGDRAPGLSTMVFVLLIAYALFRWGSGREAVTGLALMLTTATVSVIVDHSNTSELFGGFAVMIAAVSLGVALRARARARVKEADETRARERERLARDLHDTVAHHVSAIVIRAQAGLATAARDPGSATDALRVIADEASRTLAEMRTIVRDLRDGDGAELDPSPTLADIHRLASDRTADAPAITVSVDAAEPVPAPIATAAFRLAQESVTNARRHARRASLIDVRVRTGADTLELEVRDDGEPEGARGVGYGIVGMTERAQQLGGRVVAGPRPDTRGWIVTASLPLRGVAQ